MRRCLWTPIRLAFVLVLAIACSPPEAEQDSPLSQAGAAEQRSTATAMPPADAPSASESDATGRCAELPVYPGAQVYTEVDMEAADLMGRLEEMGGYGTIRVYLTKDGGGEVQSWYQDTLSGDGWQRTMHFSMDQQGLSIWELDELSAQVVTGPEQGQTAVIVACGESDAIAQAAREPATTATPRPTPTMDASASAVVGQEETFSFGDATLDVVGYQELSRVAKFMSDGEYYQPDRDKYIIVTFGYQGETAKGSLNYALFRLMDGQGRVYAMDTETYSQECSALANSHGYDYLIHWSDQERGEALLVFDVPADASGFKLGLVPEEEARVLDVVIELGDEAELIPVDADE